MKATRLFTVIPAAMALLLMSTGAAGDSRVHELEAPITSIDTAKNTLVAGGITITVTPKTEIELANGKHASLADLKVGSVVDIDGLAQKDGWEAREIEVKSKPLPIIGRHDNHKVVGAIDSIDPETRTFTVGGVAVKIAGKTKLVEDDKGPITFDKLVVGQWVEVDGKFVNERSLEAKFVEVDDDDDDKD